MASPSIAFDVVIFAPENFVPAAQDVEANGGAAITGLKIFAYVNAASVTTILSVTHGTLSVAAVAGALVDGSGTGTVTISGTAKQINATLTASDSVTYHGAQDFVGTDTLTVLTNDGYGWPVGPLSDTDQMAIHVRANDAGVAASDLDSLSHFPQPGTGDGHLTFAPPGTLVTASGFDYAYYLQNNPDVAASGVDPFQHFQQFGWKEGRDPNALFDTKGYLANYADVKAANVNPLDHYNQFGWHEGRDPSVAFDTTSYLSAYADVNAAHIVPLTHFLQFGFHEGRSAFADGAWG